MDLNDGDAVPDILESVLRETPRYIIPDDLIEEWLALADQQKFKPVLPRVAWDHLYQAISKLNYNTAKNTMITLQAINASQTGDYSMLELSLKEFSQDVILIENSLKQFQELLMTAAIVKVEGADNNG